MNLYNSVLVIFIARRPYKIGEGKLQCDLEKDMRTLERLAPHSIYAVMTVEEFKHIRKMAIRRLAKRD